MITKRKTILILFAIIFLIAGLSGFILGYDSHQHTSTRKNKKQYELFKSQLKEKEKEFQVRISDLQKTSRQLLQELNSTQTE
jgi:hypothetical protein